MAKTEKQEEKKLNYEDLLAYANQTAERAKKIYEENTQLKQMVRDLKVQMNYADINLAFKVLEFKDCFSPEFVQMTAQRLETVMSPAEPEKEENTEEQKGE